MAGRVGTQTQALQYHDTGILNDDLPTVPHAWLQSLNLAWAPAWGALLHLARPRTTIGAGEATISFSGAYLPRKCS